MASTGKEGKMAGRRRWKWGLFEREPGEGRISGEGVRALGSIERKMGLRGREWSWER